MVTWLACTSAVVLGEREIVDQEIPPDLLSPPAAHTSNQSATETAHNTGQSDSNTLPSQPRESIPTVNDVNDDSSSSHSGKYNSSHSGKYYSSHSGKYYSSPSKADSFESEYFVFEVVHPKHVEE